MGEALNVSWGTVQMAADLVTLGVVPPDAPPLRLTQTGRQDRTQVRSFVIEDLSGGLGIQRGTADKDGNRTKANQGVWVHQPGKATLPPLITAQATLQSVDASGYRNAHKAIVTGRTALGTTQPLTYYGVGPYLFRENASTGALSLADTLTNNIVFMCEVIANSTLYFAVFTDGTTDDAKVTADPTAGSISWSTYFAYASGDRIDWAMSLPGFGNGFTVFCGKLGSSQGMFYLAQSLALATAPAPAVDTTTRTLVNSSSSSTSSTKSAGFAYQVNAAGTDSPWANFGNIVSSDNSRVTNSGTNGVAMQTAWLVSGGYGFNIPTGSRVIGQTFSPEISENNANDNIFWGTNTAGGTGGFAPVVGGSIQTSLEINPSASEISTSDTTVSIGGSAQVQISTTAAQVSDDGFGMALRFCTASAGGTNPSARVDAAPITITYIPPGTQSKVPLGCRFIGPDPVTEGRLWFFRPQADDATGRTVARQLAYVDVTYQVDGDWVTVAHTVKDTGFTYLHAAVFGESELFLGVGNQNDVARHFLRYDIRQTDAGPVLQSEDLEWSGDQGYTEAWGILNLYPLGSDCILDCVLDDASVAQSWLYDHTKKSFNAFGPRETVTVYPLSLYGSGTTSPVSKFRQRFYPVSTTNLASSRQYTPDSAFLDPIAHLSGIDKQDGPLYVDLPDLDMFGPEEMDKAILTARCESRGIPANCSQILQYSTDGGSNYTTWGTFTAYGDVATLSPAVAFNSLQLRLGIDRGNTTTATPSQIRIIATGTAKFKKGRRFTINLNPNWLFGTYPAGPQGLLADLATLENTLHIQTLTYGGSTFNAIWNDEESTLQAGDSIKTLSSQPTKGQWTVVFDEVAI